MPKTTTTEKRRKGAVSINRELCKGCAYCVEACPARSLEIDTHFNGLGCFPVRVLDPEKCTGCAVCAVVCPEVVIEVWRDDES